MISHAHVRAANEDPEHKPELEWLNGWALLCLVGIFGIPRWGLSD